MDYWHHPFFNLRPVAGHRDVQGVITFYQLAGLGVPPGMASSIEVLETRYHRQKDPYDSNCTDQQKLHLWDNT